MVRQTYLLSMFHKQSPSLIEWCTMRHRHNHFCSIGNDTETRGDHTKLAQDIEIRNSISLTTLHGRLKSHWGQYKRDLSTVSIFLGDDHAAQFKLIFGWEKGLLSLEKDLQSRCPWWAAIIGSRSHGKAFQRASFWMVSHWRAALWRERWATLKPFIDYSSCMWMYIKNDIFDSVIVSQSASFWARAHDLRVYVRFCVRACVVSEWEQVRACVGKRPLCGSYCKIHFYLE